MAVEEWRELERTSEVRHEYIDGYVYAMAGATEAHNRIALNAARELDRALGRGPCIVYASDIAARLRERRFTYPDILVTCEGSGVASRAKREQESPRVVFEVLSESTERHDRTRKFGYYRACASLQEYVLVSTECQLVEVYRRTDEGWGWYRVYGPGDTVELPSIGVSVSVAALYDRTDVPEALPE